MTVGLIRLFTKELHDRGYVGGLFRSVVAQTNFTLSHPRANVCFSQLKEPIVTKNCFALLVPACFGITELALDGNLIANQYPSACTFLNFPKMRLFDSREIFLFVIIVASGATTNDLSIKPTYLPTTYRADRRFYFWVFWSLTFILFLSSTLLFAL